VHVRRLHSDRWTHIAEGCWVLGPQDPGFGLKVPPSPTLVCIESSQGNLLIDVGPNPERLKSFPPPIPIDLVVCTHGHPDHVAGMNGWDFSKVWLSHANSLAWQHKAYVLHHWDIYGKICSLGEGLARNECIQAFPDLEPLRNAPFVEWSAGVEELLLIHGGHVYGDCHPDLQHTQDLETLPLKPLMIHGQQWDGLDFGGLYFFPTRGHAPDQWIGWWSKGDVWLLSDETSAVPVWSDSQHKRTYDLQGRVSQLLQPSSLIVGGHQSYVIEGAQEGQRWLSRIQDLYDLTESIVRRSKSVDDSYFKSIEE